MLTDDLKQKVDELWNKFWANGMPEHMKALEHISYLLFMKKLEDFENDRIIAGKKTNKPYKSVFDGYDEMRWSTWRSHDGKTMLEHVKQNVFPFLKNMKKAGDRIFLDVGDTNFLIDSPILLQEAVNTIEELKISQQNLDTQGDTYEYMTSKLKTAGLNGQFRTPRHIIRMMVEIADPDVNQKICDPASGTGGFLINSYFHILKKKTSEDLIEFDEEGVPYHLVGDLLTKHERNFLLNEQFYGFDYSTSMVQISQMNMILHGFMKPNIHYTNTLGKQFDINEEYDLILANPPFSGSLNQDEINEDFGIKTPKTELLFCQLFISKLLMGGKGVVVVPTGLLYASSNAHQEIRKFILENARVDAIISIPRGVFRPYTGQATSIIYFTKGEKTKQVWFYLMKNDGFKLDTKHNKPIKDNDIPDILKTIKTKQITTKSWTATIDEIKDKKWNLDVARYKPIKEEKTEVDNPSNILKKLTKIEDQIQTTINELKNEIKTTK